MAVIEAMNLHKPHRRYKSNAPQAWYGTAQATAIDPTTEFVAVTAGSFSDLGTGNAPMIGASSAASILAVQSELAQGTCCRVTDFNLMRDHEGMEFEALHAMDSKLSEKCDHASTRLPSKCVTLMCLI